MKTVIKFFVFAITTVLSTNLALANTPDVKADLSNLISIEIEMEEPLEDAFFPAKKSSPHTKADTTKAMADSAEVEEGKTNRSDITEAQMQYQNQQFELVLKQLIPVTEEEEAYLDLYFTEIKE